MSEHKYHFGRISVYGPETNDKYSFILKALADGEIVTLKKYRYIITNEAELTYGGERYLYALLTKYRPTQESPVVDEENKELSTDQLEKSVVASAKFFIHTDAQVIAYRPISSKISDRQFKSALSEIIAQTHNRFFVAAPIDSIDEEMQIRESFGLLKKITKIIYSIRPSNPAYNPIWKPLDDDMKSLGIEKEQTISESSRGIDPDALKNDRRYMGVFMAADGYGSAHVHGEKEDGSRVVISTDSSPVTQTIIDYDEPLRVLEQLHPKFTEVRSRTRHE